MRIVLLFPVLLAAGHVLPLRAQEPPAAPAETVAASPKISDAQVAARESALTLAGAFANDGFKVRDGHWFGTLTGSTRKAVEVNLYAGNEYWFSLGANAGAKAVEVKVFDENGVQVNSESYAEGATAAAGLRPETSGSYFVEVGDTTGADATFCLVYSYK